MTYTRVSLKEWQNLTGTNVHFMQTDFWQRVKSATGWQAHHIIIEGQDTLAGIQILVKHQGQFNLGYTGRFWPDIKGHTDVSTILNCLKNFAQNQKLTVLTIDPSLYLNTDIGEKWLELVQNDNRFVYAKQIQSRGTALSDLSSFDSLYDSLAKGTRYNIRNAEKRGISIEITPATKESFEEFWDLYVETAKRKGFILRPKSYYLHLIESAKNTTCELYITYARHPDEKQPVSASFMLLNGKNGWLLYAASSLRQRNLMPNDLLEYRNLEFAFKHGIQTFDWWGAPFNPDDTTDPMYSVWKFKSRFHAQHKQLVGAWDYYPANLKSFLFRLLNFARNSWLLFRKKTVAIIARFRSLR